MIKKMQKSVILMVVFGLLLAAAAPSALAQDRCRRRGNFNSARSFDNDNFRRDRRDYYNDYYDRENTTGKAVKRTGIGAGIGAVGGALIGGGKGAVIGGLLGGAGGYIYHQKKVNDQRGRRFRY
ncbi:MAG TPA: YMGG-like glycine zipper-containing protein [Blastocatellia bacterium]|nr:YMGG-like glycine zipper-containing protein [Blastocatellia bacterium]